MFARFNNRLLSKVKALKVNKFSTNKIGLGWEIIGMLLVI